MTTSAPKPTVAKAEISTELLTLLFTTTLLSGIETETISNSPETLPSADRTSSAQPPQSIPATANFISWGGSPQPIKSTMASNNRTDDKRITNIGRPPLSTDRPHDV
ncbi:hypothetical protein F4009_15500 [Candidatus Poribacteria bacterium]|nr:hypothetical protein [Candidatus Poribacteria bacterium]MYH79595.1 hypothetical protein [Candidatus Poribacteria bacterium]MYK95377.1 hypothetical protein [Candidatus Poribacteria bacterium]